MTLGIAFFFTGFLFMATSFIYRVGSIAAKSATPGTEYGRGLPDFVLGSTAINRPLQ